MKNNYKNIRTVGVQRESLERLVVIQKTVAEAVLECMKKGKFKMVVEYGPESPKVIMKMYTSSCEAQPDIEMEF